jgi:hypothetical protein
MMKEPGDGTPGGITIRPCCCAKPRTRRKRNSQEMTIRISEGRLCLSGRVVVGGFAWRKRQNS